MTRLRPVTKTASGDQTVPVRAAPGETVAAGMQLAIAVLTAGLDSPELEAWAADAFTPRRRGRPG